MISAIGRDIDRRNKTDIRIYPSMVFAILILYTAVVFYCMAIPELKYLDPYSVAMVGCGLMMAVMFVMASRTFRHSKRDADMIRDVGTFYASTVPDGEDDPDVKLLRKCIYDNRMQKMLFVLFILSMVPAVFGVLVFLRGFTYDPDRVSRDLMFFSLVFSLFTIMININFSKKHEVMFQKFSAAVVPAFAKQGLVLKEYEQVIGDRNLYLMIMLCVVSLGLFIMVWLCISIRDFNRHMDEQWNFENNLYQGLRILAGRDAALAMFEVE